MKKSLVVLILLFLSGCNSLNYRTAPLVMDNCQYSALSGVQFIFNRLPRNTQNYSHIYVAQSRESSTLSANYAGMKGKLTDQIFVRDYPKQTFWRAQSLLERVTLYDDGYDDVYISAAQKEKRDREAKSVFRQAILQNCQIVYIAIDSLTEDRDNPQLIEVAHLSIIK